MIILGVSIWALLLIALFVIVLCWNVETENPIGATIGLGIFLAIAHFSSLINIGSVFVNWQTTLTYTGIHFACGIGWGFIKWIFYVNNWAENQRKIVDNKRSQFLKALKISGNSIPQEHKPAWERFVKEPSAVWGLKGRPEDEYFSTLSVSDQLKYDPRYEKLDNLYSRSDLNYEYPLANHYLKVSNNIGLITLWCVYWPFSLLWTIINDPVKKIFGLLIQLLGKFFDLVTNRALARVESEIYK